MNATLPKLTQATARLICRGLGVSFKSLPETREFRISYKGASYFTDDLQDAVDTARSGSFTRDLQGKSILA